MAKQTRGARRPSLVSLLLVELANDLRARDGFAKRMLGKPTTQRDESALRRIDAAVLAEIIDAAYAAVPKKLWCEASGRQPRTINEQAKRYGLPLDSAFIDLRALAPALHDFLAANAHRFGNADESVEADERYRQAKAELAELELDQRRGGLVRVEDLEAGWSVIAGCLRRAGDQLQRAHGAEAQMILADALDEAERAIGRMLGRPA